jgi:SulP family sulfate permease
MAPAPRLPDDRTGPRPATTRASTGTATTTASAPREPSAVDPLVIGRRVRHLRTHPKSSSIVMVATVIVTVATHDLAKGVLTGVLLSALFFARKVGQVLHVASVEANEGRERHYTVTGQVFFASAEAFVSRFDFREAVEKVVIDLRGAHFWDLSAVGALDKVVLKFRREGTAVELLGMNEASATLVDRLGVHDKPDAERLMGGH